MLFFFALFAFLELTESACQHDTASFDCTTLACPSDRVTCVIGNQTQCQCKDGFLWRTPSGNTTKDICAYEQYTKKEASIWQGCFILIGVSGTGMVRIGRTAYGVGQIVFSFSLIFLFCIGAGLGSCMKLEGSMVCGGCLSCLGVIAHMVWWGVSLALLVSGSFTDGAGCPLA